MPLINAVKGDAKVLCNKGLARRQGLIDFLYPHATSTAEEMEAGNPRADLVLRHDDGVIREVFNTRCGDLSLADGAALQPEWVKREALLRTIYRLYSIGHKRTPADLRRQLHGSEVEAVISSIQRLNFMGMGAADGLLDFCEQSANGDDDVLAHVMDPLQLRYILTFHCPTTRDELCRARVNTLIDACRARDGVAVKSWFSTLTSTTDTLPGDAPQFFRSVLLDLWKTGGADLSFLAYEIAVLDAQLFEELGWESTRSFCAQLRRITGPGCEVFDAYLTDEDIDGALIVAEELHQEELIIHFRKLATTYSTKSHRDMRKSVLTAAGQAREPEQAQVATKLTSSSERRASTSAYQQTMGWSPATS